MSVYARIPDFTDDIPRCRTGSSPSIKAIEIMSKPRSGLIKSPRGKRDVSRGSKLTGRTGGREEEAEGGGPGVISSTARNPSNVIYL